MAIQDPGTPIAASANSAAAGALAPSLAAVAGELNYITGFTVTGAGATAASVVAITVTGLVGGTQTYYLAVPAGVAVGFPPLAVTFEDPVPATNANVAIVVNVPTLGAGNVAVACVVTGRQI